VKEDARERLLRTAYELFSRHGVQAVGIDAIIAHSGVARQTLYRHFGSKQELVLAFMERREQLWTLDWLHDEVHRRAADPPGRLLAIFDVFHGWFQTAGFEGCSFINVMLEHPDAHHPLHVAASAHLARIRALIAQLASDAGIADPDAFAAQWHILMKGSIVAAGEGDREAAHRAQAIGRLLLADTPAPGRAHPVPPAPAPRERVLTRA
jgi:AcrR family transcriptional regulator